MILKRDLLNALDELTYQLFKQGEEIRSLQKRVSKLEPKKNKVGRPRKTK